VEGKGQAEIIDQEALDKTKKANASPITNAILIGFLVGIIIYSIAVNSIGIFTLIPLFFLYKLLDRT